MKITAAGLEIEARSIIEETYGQDRRPAIRVVLPAGISRAKQDALRSGDIVIDGGYARYQGYTILVEHAMVLVRPVDVAALEEQLRQAQMQLDALRAKEAMSDE